MADTFIEFDWDPAKAVREAQCLVRRRSDGLWRPPRLSRPDDHSNGEERWITVGMSKNARLLVVVHTHVEIEDDHIYSYHLGAPADQTRETPI